MKMWSLFLLTICLGYGSISNSQEKPSALSKKMTRSEYQRAEAKSFVVGAELRSYRYSESRVTHSGLLYGFWGEWYWRTAIGDGKLYGNFLYGTIDYDGYSCNSAGLNCNPLKAPTTDLITRLATRFEWKTGPNFEIFAGIGYRYLYDKGQGGSFYTRTGQWIYLPLGGTLKLDKLLFELEYDWIPAGIVRSNLSEAISTLPDVESKQSSGSGIVVTSGYCINNDFAIYVFYETWNMPDSDSVFVDTGTGISKLTEPKNEAQSFGLKLGYLF